MNTIKELFGRPIAFYPYLAKKLGGVNEALLLQQLIYWSDKGKRKDGYIYKTKKEICSETCLSRYQQDKARKTLEGLGVIKTKIKKANGKPTLHYKVEFPIVRNLLFQSLETSDSEKRETSDSITENTTETTTIADESAFNLSEELEKLKTSNNYTNLYCGFVIKYNQLQFENEEQFTSYCGMARKYAKEVKGYKPQDWVRTAEWLSERDLQVTPKSIANNIAQVCLS